MIQPCLGINADGRLTRLRGATPFLLPKNTALRHDPHIDEETVRRNCRIYKSALAKLAPSARFPFTPAGAIAVPPYSRIVAEEGLGADAGASPGEIATAVKQAFPWSVPIFT